MARSITRIRLHERLLRSAGVRLERAGAALLHNVRAEAGSLLVTDRVELLDADTPTVTHNVQQLEREELAVGQIDPDDRRAIRRIGLIPAGRLTLERPRRGRRDWLDQPAGGWDDNDPVATLLGRFGDNGQRDLEGRPCLS